MEQLKKEIIKHKPELKNNIQTIGDNNNDITFEIIKDYENNKCVKVSVSLDIESSNDIINIEFLISKETYLKLANQLK